MQAWGFDSSTFLLPNTWEPDHRKAYNAQWYQENKDAQKARVKARTLRIKQKIRERKDQPCADCGNKYPHYVMDFDHVRGVKEFSIANAAHRRSEAKIEAELAKCDLVCANCHRIRTHERLALMA